MKNVFVLGLFIAGLLGLPAIAAEFCAAPHMAFSQEVRDGVEISISSGSKSTILGTTTAAAAQALDKALSAKYGGTPDPDTQAILAVTEFGRSDHLVFVEAFGSDGCTTGKDALISVAEWEEISAGIEFDVLLTPPYPAQKMRQRSDTI